MKSSLLYGTAASLTAFSAMSNASMVDTWNVGAGVSALASQATIPLTRYPGQQTIPMSITSGDTWLNICTQSANPNNKLWFSYDTATVNPNGVIGSFFMKMTFDGTTYTSGLTAASSTLEKPSTSDNFFSGIVEPTAGGSSFFWYLYPPTGVTWNSNTTLASALAEEGMVLRVSPSPTLDPLFISDGGPALMSTGMPSDIPSPASSLVLGGLAGLTGLKRQRHQTLEVENS